MPAQRLGVMMNLDHQLARGGCGTSMRGVPGLRAARQRVRQKPRERRNQKGRRLAGRWELRLAGHIPFRVTPEAGTGPAPACNTGFKSATACMISAGRCRSCGNEPCLPPGPPELIRCSRPAPGWNAREPMPCADAVPAADQGAARARRAVLAPAEHLPRAGRFSAAYRLFFSATF